MNEFINAGRRNSRIHPTGVRGRHFICATLSLVGQLMAFTGAIENCRGEVTWDSMQKEVDDSSKSAVFDYYFHNRGPDHVRLDYVAGDCSCLRLNWPREPVIAGRKGQIHAEYDLSKARAGKTYHSITVIWADKSRHTLTFSVLRPRLGVFSPARLIWDRETDWSPQEAEFITSPDVSISAVSADRAMFDVKLQKISDLPRWRIVATPTPVCGAGEYSIDINVRHDPSQEEVSHRLYLRRLISPDQRAKAFDRLSVNSKTAFAPMNESRAENSPAESLNSDRGSTWHFSSSNSGAHSVIGKAILTIAGVLILLRICKGPR